MAEQEAVKKLAEQYGSADLIVVLGLNQLKNLQVMALTFRDGDPSYAGPLAGMALGLPCYHILELKDEIPAQVWQEEMAMHELELEDELQSEICRSLREIRQGE